MIRSELDERSRTVLNSVVLNYIKTAFPIASRMITKETDLALSAATIRNIMADLEEMGYLDQPHTSSGRIPTDKGYRFYVDSLLEEGLHAKTATIDWASDGPPHGRGEDLNDILKETTRSLSALSRYAGILSVPKISKMVFQHLDFTLLKSGHILAIFVSADGFVQNRLIESSRDLTQDELDRIAAELNDRFHGMSLAEIRNRLLQEMRREKEQYDNLLKAAVELGEKALIEPRADELYIGGASNILDLPDFADIENMKNVFKAFKDKYRMIQLLDRCLESDGVQVLIGSENQASGMEGCSLVVTTYRSRDAVLGTVGILGPKRMDYSRVIPLVETTGRRLTRLLEKI